MHETLYHLHEPETITEANTWLMQFLLHYNQQPHRRESHSRIEDWMRNLTKDGIRQMCSWERFCTFAREPEKRKVGIDARITVDGVAYEVEPDLAGEKVILWWGLFDSELYVEHQEHRYGPYAPIGKPIPLHSYRSFKKSNTQKRADRIEAIASQLTLPTSAIGKVSLPVVSENVIPFPVRSFVDPDPFEELTFKNAIEALISDRILLSQTLGETNLRTNGNCRVNFGGNSQKRGSYDPHQRLFQSIQLRGIFLCLVK
jgi:hypothetical protein